MVVRNPTRVMPLVRALNAAVFEVQLQHDNKRNSAAPFVAIHGPDGRRIDTADDFQDTRHAWRQHQRCTEIAARVQAALPEAARKMGAEPEPHCGQSIGQRLRVVVDESMTDRAARHWVRLNK